MKFHAIDAVLLCVLCFLTGAATMLCYIQMQTPKPDSVQPIVNVYITTSKNEEVDVQSVDTDSVEIIEEETEKLKEKKWYSEDDVRNMAKMAYGESMNVPTLDTPYGERSNQYQNACAMYTVLNRVDAGYGGISRVIQAKGQFVGYNATNPIDWRLYNLAQKVIEDWATGEEKLRVLPSEYLYFGGDGKHNYFKTADGVKYDWHIPDPFQ